MSEPGGADENQPEKPGWPTVVRFVSQPTAADLVWNNAESMRRNGFWTAAGTFVIVQAVIGFYFLRDVVSLIGVLLGLSFVTGLFVMPFVWWSIRQRRDLVLAPVSVAADADGLSLSTPLGESRVAWTVYRRARETKRAFKLDTGAASSLLLVKRGIGPAEIAGFRGLLLANGILPANASPAQRFRPLMWVTLGLILAVVSVLPFILPSLTATVALDASASVAGHEATISGTTNLPDGTMLAVQVFQLDEWQRAEKEGSDAVATFRWIDLDAAVVEKGRFQARTDMTGWPAGRGMAAIYFAMDESQPQAAVDRFGVDAAGLRAPGVYEDEDTGRTLRIARPFDVPP